MVYALVPGRGYGCRSGELLAEDLGLQTRNDPSPLVGVTLQVPAGMGDLVHTGHLASQPGAIQSTQSSGT